MIDISNSYTRLEITWRIVWEYSKQVQQFVTHVLLMVIVICKYLKLMYFHRWQFNSSQSIHIKIKTYCKISAIPLLGLKLHEELFETIPNIYNSLLVATIDGYSYF